MSLRAKKTEFIKLMKTGGKQKLMVLLTVVGLLLSSDLLAQNQNGLFSNKVGQSGNNSLLGRENRTQNGMDWQSGMIPQDPTQEAPLGGGLILFVMASVGYMALKTKGGKEEQR